MRSFHTSTNIELFVAPSRVISMGLEIFFRANSVTARRYHSAGCVVRAVPAAAG
jgi:hypothetical protein